MREKRRGGTQRSGSDAKRSDFRAGGVFAATGETEQREEGSDDMSSKVNHVKRSHRSHAKVTSAIGSINRTSYVRGSDSYSGKNYAVRLGMFKKWLAGRRAEKQAAEVEE